VPASPDGLDWTLKRPRSRQGSRERAAEAVRTYTSLEIRSALTHREACILHLRAGAGWLTEPVKLRAIGETFGIGEERARAIVNASVGKLKHYRESSDPQERQIVNS